jgi:hypothetical protein
MNTITSTLENTILNNIKDVKARKDILASDQLKEYYKALYTAHGTDMFKPENPQQKVLCELFTETGFMRWAIFGGEYQVTNEALEDLGLTA